VTVTEDFETIEARASEHLADEGGHLEEDLEVAASRGAGEEAPLEGSPLRLAVAVALSTIGAAVMVGGVFIGASARVFASLAGVAGVALAAGASRIRRPTTTNIVIAVGLLVIGLLAVVPTGLSNLGSLRTLVSISTRNGSVTRPPVRFDAGWHSIVAWLLAIVGFAAAWVALELRRPAIGLLIPLPMAAVAGISVPKHAQVSSGIVVLALFAVGLGLVSSTRGVRDEEEKPPLGYELRRAGRGLVFIAVITGALIGLAQANILFPKPIIDPTKQPQRPHTAPLNPADDRILFEATPPTGPFRTGSLDVYDGTYWRLPPFADSKLRDVPTSGIVDPTLPTGTAATITIRGLSGAVLPTLPNTVGIVARGRLAYDARNGNIRESEGSVAPGFTYQVAAAPLPKIADLEADTDPLPPSVEQFTQVPPPPPAVVDLLDRARAQYSNKWDQYFFLFNAVRNTVTASGEGVATAVTPARVQDMLAGSKQGSPFEIVAAEALLARWDGVPSRIAYGYDIVHGDHVLDGKFQAHPNDGATFVEVYFPRFEWVPLNAPPKRARPTVGTNPNNQQVNPQVLPSNDIGVQLYLPVLTQPASVLGRQLLVILGIVFPAVLLLLLLYYLYPALAKARLRSKRRTAARAAGPRARIALAYSEWRDYATDFGYAHSGDTPLAFLERFVPDEEHSELAWLVTRTLWGDLQGEVDNDLALYAEELSRTLRRRLADAHPATVRFVAAVSRLSVRNPYIAESPRPSQRKETSLAGISS
jgi:hypothetical protein